MDKLIIEGGRPLKGTIRISGAKNAALPLICATLLAPGTYRLANVPDLRDTRTILSLLASFGATSQRLATGELEIDTTAVSDYEASYDLVKTMRASVLVLGPLLARLGRARVSLPGGCAIGARPIDFHLKGFANLGVSTDLNHGYVEASVAGRMHGGTVYFDIPTVTGTENILMAAALADGETVIKNAAREPEIGNLIDMLTAMGARIEGKGTDLLRIIGVPELHAADATVIPDRIETGTYLIAVAAAGGEVELEGCNPAHLPSLLEKLKIAGLHLEQRPDSIRVAAQAPPKSVDIKTLPYPGFPTDLQAQMMALMNLADGLSVIVETIFENRFMHVAELRRMGADIRIDGRSAVVSGTGRYTGARVMATDLRASASLVVAGLAAEGVTEISRIYHLERGYENLIEKLQAVGAGIWRGRE
ncbi:MAG: UDP-N-acetylglucosamine 1-carboxyvinyltransferase [Thermodesulfobacteriota bacterium]